MSEKIKRMIELFDQCQGSYAEIARQMGISREYVRQVMNPLGYKSSKKRNLKQYQDLGNQVRALIAEGKRQWEIRKELGLSPRKFKTVVQYNSLDAEPAKRRYTTAYIIELYNECNGFYRLMAERLSVSDTVIHRVMTRRNLREEYPNKLLPRRTQASLGKSGYTKQEKVEEEVVQDAQPTI